MCSIYHSVLLMRKNAGSNPLNLFHSLQGFFYVSWIVGFLRPGVPKLSQLTLIPTISVSIIFFIAPLTQKK